MKLYTNNMVRYMSIQGVIEKHGIILTTSYWLHVELGKNM
jgi:hypothetical protein